MDLYIQEEMSHDALLGLFEEPAFPIHVSPFMSREKSGSDRRRVIIDLSWPKLSAVNDAVKENEYLGVEYTLTLPTLDHVLRAVKNLAKILT